MPIFDQGYQHWKGELSGHGWRWLAITKHGVRIGFKSFLLRMLLLAAVVPALALAGVISIWGLAEQGAPWAVAIMSRLMVNDPPAFRVTVWTVCFHFFLFVEMFYVMILVVLVGPNLISQDLRLNAFPLYFSRPLRRIDYFVGKLGVIAFFLGMVAVVPALVAWVLGLCFSLSFQAIADTFPLILGVVAFGVVVSLSAGLLILALSSLSRNSRYVGAMWGGIWLLTWAVSGVFEGLYTESIFRRQYQLERQVANKQGELNGERTILANGTHIDFPHAEFGGQPPFAPPGAPPFPGKQGPPAFAPVPPGKPGSLPFHNHHPGVPPGKQQPQLPPFRNLPYPLDPRDAGFVGPLPQRPYPLDPFDADFVGPPQRSYPLDPLDANFVGPWPQHLNPPGPRMMTEEEKKQCLARIAKLEKEIAQLEVEYDKYHEEQDQLLRDDWRPLISYMHDLWRVGFALIGSQAAFRKLDDTWDKAQQQMRQGKQNRPKQDAAPRDGDDSQHKGIGELETRFVPQYPWYWSALVLLGLGGLSAWILHKRVTSLDRLK